jgi:hypothetical protein
MSALPPKADIGARPSHVRFVPIADILASQRDVRFYLESGHLLASIEYPLSAISRSPDHLLSEAPPKLFGY